MILKAKSALMAPELSKQARPDTVLTQATG